MTKSNVIDVTMLDIGVLLNLKTKNGKLYPNGTEVKSTPILGVSCLKERLFWFDLGGSREFGYFKIDLHLILTENLNIDKIYLGRSLTYLSEEEIKNKNYVYSIELPQR